jgi:hypothetical protein
MNHLTLSGLCLLLDSLQHSGVSNLKCGEKNKTEFCGVACILAGVFCLTISNYKSQTISKLKNK